MAVLDAPVALTVGIESQPYLGELSLELTASDKDRNLRVTLLIGEQELTEYEGTVAAGTQNVLLIPLSANTAGELICRIYLDGALYEETTVTLR